MKVKYLTWLYEKTGKHEDSFELPPSVTNIKKLMDYLEQTKSECSSVFKNRHVIYTAVGNEIKTHDFEIKNSDEVSFFSAIVGG